MWSSWSRRAASLFLLVGLAFAWWLTPGKEVVEVKEIPLEVRELQVEAHLHYEENLLRGSTSSFSLRFEGHVRAVPRRVGSLIHYRCEWLSLSIFHGEELIAAFAAHENGVHYRGSREHLMRFNVDLSHHDANNDDSFFTKSFVVAVDPAGGVHGVRIEDPIRKAIYQHSRRALGRGLLEDFLNGRRAWPRANLQDGKLIARFNEEKSKELLGSQEGYTLQAQVVLSPTAR